jgi:hypothetical protein
VTVLLTVGVGVRVLVGVTVLAGDAVDVLVLVVERTGVDVAVALAVDVAVTVAAASCVVLSMLEFRPLIGMKTRPDRPSAPAVSGAMRAASTTTRATSAKRMDGSSRAGRREI